MTKRHKSQPAQAVASPNRGVVAFSMPEAIDPTAWMTDYTGVFYNPYGEYYQPPIERKGLAKVARANAHHGAILMARRNMVAGRFTNQRATITAFVHNYLQQGKPNLIYRPEDVIWLAQYDPEQQVYGMPDYLGGLQSALLNQDATLFRRKYFLNGAHMGFIFYATDPNMDDDTEEEMKEMIASSKGGGELPLHVRQHPGRQARWHQADPGGGYRDQG